MIDQIKGFIYMLILGYVLVVHVFPVVGFRDTDPVQAVRDLR